MEDKVIPQTLLTVEWGLQCSRALRNLRSQIETCRLETYTAANAEADPEKRKEYKLTIELLDKVEQWADTGKPWID